MEYENIKKLKKQWLKKHAVVVILVSFIILANYMAGVVLESILLIGVNTIYVFVMCCVAKNSMESFIEENKDKD